MTDNKRKVLIAHASWAGSTAAIAERVAEVLNRNGFTAEAAPAGKVKDVSGYDAVVLGTAVHAGKLKPDALKFVDRNNTDLNRRPFAAFDVCMTMKGCDEESKSRARAYLDPLRTHVKPLSEGLFAGAYDQQKLDFVSRQIMKMIKAPPGDFRKWDEIEAWAASLVQLFGGRL